jgi:hypothetical protein
MNVNIRLPAIKGAGASMCRWTATSAAPSSGLDSHSSSKEFAAKYSQIPSAAAGEDQL